MEPKDPDLDLISSISVCSFEPSSVSKSLSFYHRIFAFLCFLIQLEKLLIRSFVSLHKNLKDSDTKWICLRNNAKRFWASLLVHMQNRPIDFTTSITAAIFVYVQIGHNIPAWASRVWVTRQFGSKAEICKNNPQTAKLLTTTSFICPTARVPVS